MTHTLHRQGDAVSLGEDFVLLMLPAPGYNVAGSTEKLRKFLEIALRHSPVNFGISKKGTRITVTPEKLSARITDGNCVHAVFRRREDLTGALRDLKKADLGISVTATGLFKEIRRACRLASLTPHTVQYSLGIWGDRGSYRPPQPVLDTITMCGHGMVPAALVEKLIGEVRLGQRTPGEAAAELGRLCGCGVFNALRAADLLHEAAHAADEPGNGKGNR